MNAVQRKLCDRSGATLTVALLFFIMCAAAGSVILAAATTSTGRLSELQASDQNYYAVVSAAKLIRDEIDGETIGVKQTEMKTTTVTTKTDNGGTPDDTSDDTIVEETKIEYTYSRPTFVYGTKDAHTNKLKFVDATGDKVYLLDALTCTSKNEAGAAQKRTGSLTNVHKTTNGSDSFVAKDELYGKTYSDAQEAFTSPLMNGTDHVYTDTFTMTASLNGFTFPGSVASTLPVDVRIVMNGQGNIKAYIKNHLDAGAKKQGNEYRLMLTLDAEEGSVQSDSSNGTSEDGSGNATTESKTAEDTTTSTESTSVTRHSYVTWGNPQITKDTSTNVW
ncbi:hypothetical protein [Oribacterium sp. HCP3S3_B9]|uniref:hypothetical protein n=1 Tax=Oribacterium sp. HCP3S3_B9 TaxID=3438946 RepID=UPI003F89E75B